MATGFIFLTGKVDQPENQRPARIHHQAVRKRIVVEIYGRHARVAGIDAHVLDAQQQEQRPENVGEPRGAPRRFDGSFESETFGRLGTDPDDREP
jgi:hypothetical protein